MLVKHRATRTTWRRAGPRLARTHGIKRCYVSTAPCFPCGQFSQPPQSYEASLIREAQRSLPSVDSIHRPSSQQWGDGSQQWGDGSQRREDGSQQWGDGSQQWEDSSQQWAVNSGKMAVNSGKMAVNSGKMAKLGVV